MYELTRTQYVPRPLEEVFAFFADAGNLERITPPWLCFKILTPRPIYLQAGTLIDYRLKLFGVPFYWRTKIEEFESNRRFVDSQVKGPYRRWWHTHTFRAVEGGTEVIDHVEYAMPAGPIGRIIHGVLTRHQLKTIFDYRFKVIKELFPATAS
jgi:ligand-binding SRPBCC domain-containing protein